MSCTAWLNQQRDKQFPPATALKGTHAPISELPEPKPWKASWNEPAPADRQAQKSTSKPAQRQSEPKPEPITVTPENAENVKLSMREREIRRAQDAYCAADHTPGPLKYKERSTELNF
jgi:hypothetical protein